MRDFLDRLLVLNCRDIIGLFLWLLVAIVSCRMLGWRGLVLCLAVMVMREVYQWRHYRLAHFEWADVVRYALVILVAWGIAMMIR